MSKKRLETRPSIKGVLPSCRLVLVSVDWTFFDKLSKLIYKVPEDSLRREQRKTSFFVLV